MEGRVGEGVYTGYTDRLKVGLTFGMSQEGVEDPNVCVSFVEDRLKLRPKYLYSGFKTDGLRGDTLGR